MYTGDGNVPPQHKLVEYFLFASAERMPNSFQALHHSLQPWKLLPQLPCRNATAAGEACYAALCRRHTDQQTAWRSLVLYPDDCEKLTHCAGGSRKCTAARLVTLGPG